MCKIIDVLINVRDIGKTFGNMHFCPYLIIIIDWKIFFGKTYFFCLFWASNNASAVKIDLLGLNLIFHFFIFMR